jgi:hypothetical protein
MLLFYFLILALLSVFSFAFRDPNLPVLLHPPLRPVMGFLTGLVFEKRLIGTAVFTGLLAGLVFLYLKFLRQPDSLTKSLPLKTVCLAGLIISLSYPALTHDLFNYLTTAKVLYHYGENPYVVMPVEIPSEPYLAFTRAANKVALYGPVWLGLSAVPHYLGADNLLLTIMAFKLLAGFSYLLMVLSIYRLTKRIYPALLFALNPLVIIEVLISGHNDLWMMLPAVWGLFFLEQKSLFSKLKGTLLLVISALVKGASLILIPLAFLRLSREKQIRISYFLMLSVFVVFGPLREELYPWYFIWAIVFAALDGGKSRLILVLTAILSVTLELRHLPYLASGRYDGYGPAWRTLVSVVPAGTYCFYYLWQKLRKNSGR